MLVLISFFVMFVASMFPFLSGFTLESWAQSNSEFESRLIFGNTTAVNDNYTIGINDNLVVSLALIDTKISDQILREDGIHFISVVCPIRSPVVVSPVTSSINSDELTQSSNLTQIDGIVYCQASNISDIKSKKSINEQLIDAKLATFDSKNCNNQTFAYPPPSRIENC
jgi:hypothetical protein